MQISRLTFRLFGASCVLTILSFAFSSACSAGLLLEFTGLDVAFDGTDITDVSAGLHPLTTLTIEADGAPVSGSPFVGGVAGIDLVIPGVDPIPVGGGAVGTAPGGKLDLDLGGAGFLSLTLGPATVSFLDLGVLQFAFAASEATVDGQSLPDGVLLADPISVSFSTSVDGFADDGSFLTSFIASGTGEINGGIVPEPTSLAAALLGLFGYSLVRRRPAD